MSINSNEVYVFTVQNASRFLTLGNEEDITKTLQGEGFREDHNGHEGLGGGGFLVYTRDPATGEHTAKRVIDYLAPASGSLEQVMDQYLRELKAFPNSIVVEQADVPAVMALMAKYPRHTAYAMKKTERKTEQSTQTADAAYA